jgi:predicted PurR-regulated permease PerM
MKSPLSALLGMAALVIVIAGLREIRDVAVPFVLALLLVSAVSPAVRALHKRRIPRPIAVALVILAVTLVATLAGGLVVASLRDFANDLPVYEARLTELWSGLVAQLGPENMPKDVKDLFDPGVAMRTAGTALNAVVGLAQNVLVILLIAVFLFAESAGIPAKVRAVFGDESAEDLTEAGDQIQRYLGVKTVISAATGGLVFVLNLAFGLDYVLLWAALAFVLNFIPAVGSIVAGAPAVLLALIQLGPGQAVGIAIGYVVINTVIGSVLEPRVMGGQLGLSPLVIFMSLLLWGFIWGPAGMLLCVPLMVALKIVLESHPTTRGIAIFLGPSKGVEADP